MPHPSEGERSPNRFTIGLEPNRKGAYSIRNFRDIPIEEIIRGFPRTLTEGISTLLADPFIEINRNQDAVAPLIVAAALPAHAPQLKEAFAMLNQELKLNQGELSFNTSRRLAALLIANMLLYQTALPIDKKTGIRFSHQRRETTRAMQLIHAGLLPDEETTQQRNLLTQTMQAFQEELAKVLVQEPQTKNEAYFQALLYNAINKIMRDSSLYLEFQYYGDLKMGQWITTRENLALAFISTSPFSFDLLQQDVFEELDSHGLALIFAGQWELFHKTAPDEEKLTALANYFLSRPRLQDEFWEGETVDDDYPIIKWFFEQDTETLGRFIETMRLPTTANKLINIRSVVIAYTGYLKYDFPNHPNVPYLLQLIRSLAEQFNLTQRIQEELAILEDREPGVLHESANKGLVARLAQPGETREEFLSRIRKLRNVIYISQAPWPQRAQEVQPAPAAREAVTPMVISGELQTNRLWGKVQVVNGEAAQPVLEVLARTTRQITQGQLNNLITENRANLATADSAPFIIMPALLPTTNPLRKLDACGVVAIEFTNGSLAIVVDAAKAGIQTIGPKRIIIKTEVGKEFTDSSLDRFFSAASLFAKRSIVNIKLERQDERKIAGVVSSWNRKNNDMGKDANTKDQVLPLLSFGDRPDQASRGRVLFFVGKRLTTLDLVA